MEQVISGIRLVGILAYFFISCWVLGIFLGVGTLSSALGVGGFHGPRSKMQVLQGSSLSSLSRPSVKTNSVSLPLFLFSLSLSCFLSFSQLSLNFLSSSLAFSSSLFLLPLSPLSFSLPFASLTKGACPQVQPLRRCRLCRRVAKASRTLCSYQEY